MKQEVESHDSDRVWMEVFKILFKAMVYFCVFYWVGFFFFGSRTNAIELIGSLAYNVAKNESYIDTIDDKDIYWNPNSGFRVLAGIQGLFFKNLQWRLDSTLTLGYYKYNTTDGRKVNTEAQAKNVPKTVNVEWSRIISLVPSIGYYHSNGSWGFSFGVGAGPTFSRTYESWQFTDVLARKAKLEIKKYYPIEITLLARVGLDYAITGKIKLLAELRFESLNIIMNQVDLTSYTIDEAETIDQYKRSQKTYVYSRNVPNESKGGKALLAGFNFSNYPQEKIASIVSLSFGIIYTL